MNILNKFPRRNIVKEGLVLWLDGKDFTNNPNCTQLRNRIGNGNNATPNGFAYTSESGSNGGGGVVFDGIDDYANISTNEKIYCLESVFKINSFLNHGGIITTYNNISKMNFSVSTAPATGILEVTYGYGTSRTIAMLNLGVVIDTVYHIIIQYNETTGYLKVFLNNNLVYDLLCNVVIEVNDVWLGTWATVPYTYKGSVTIYQARAYNRTLTQAEITQNYLALGGKYD